MPKNVQTTTQMHSFHMLAKSCSKSFKLGFNSMWTENFQMYNLDLEKAQEPEIIVLDIFHLVKLLTLVKWKSMSDVKSKKT